MATREKEDQGMRVKDYMNYQIMNEMPEYEAEFDQMLFYLPLAGSSFKKVYYDEMIGRAVSKFVQADDLIVPYAATSWKMQKPSFKECTCQKMIFVKHKFLDFILILN